MTLPRKHLHTLPCGPTLPDATSNEEGFPFLLETITGQLTVRTLYQVQAGGWSGIGVTPLPAEVITGDHTLSLGDVGRIIDVNGGSGVTITVPPYGTTPLPVGASVTVVNLTSNAVTIAGANGVTVNALGGSLALAGQWAQVTLRQRDIDLWVLAGDLD